MSASGETSELSEGSRLSDQGSVLADVRRALGRSATTRPAPLEPFVEGVAEESPEDIAERFETEASAVGALVHHAPSVGEAAALVARICAEAGVKDVALSDSPLLDEMNLCAQVAAHSMNAFRATGFAGKRHELIARLESCGAGVSAVEYAIAETGTVVVSSDEEGGLLVSLLPAVHIALLRSGRVVGSLAGAVIKLKQDYMGRDAACRSATFITGPSRTSDVELVLSIGVHGPKQLHLIIVDG
jgi:L-lactate dehydrogenase complex protein LldG